MKKRLGPTDRIYPMPCPLVLGGTLDSCDALAVAWIGIASGRPPSLAMALRKTRRTLELIRETGEFTVNIPRASQADVVDYFGIASGRDTDKFDDTGWTLQPSALVSAPLIAECPYNLECRVTHEVDIGDYALVIGEILESHAEESVLAASGDRVDVSALDPLVYIAGSREYRRLGEKVADAFSAGKVHRPSGAGVQVRVARDDDAQQIATLVRTAFQSQCRLYADDSLPPLSETRESVIEAMGQGVTLVAEQDGRIVGSVRGTREPGDPHTIAVGRLVVEPESQGAGVGRTLAVAIERHFPDAERFEIFTGHRSVGPLHLYESLGYERVREEPVHERLTLIHLAKRV